MPADIDIEYEKQRQQASFAEADEIRKQAKGDWREVVFQIIAGTIVFVLCVWGLVAFLNFSFGDLADKMTIKRESVSTVTGEVSTAAYHEQSEQLKATQKKSDEKDRTIGAQQELIDKIMGRLTDAEAKLIRISQAPTVQEALQQNELDMAEQLAREVRQKNIDEIAARQKVADAESRARAQQAAAESTAIAQKKEEALARYNFTHNPEVLAHFQDTFKWTLVDVKARRGPYHSDERYARQLFDDYKYATDWRYGGVATDYELNAFYRKLIKRSKAFEKQYGLGLWTAFRVIVEERPDLFEEY